jgi:Putative beta-barrel porin-2, OmpL-like. bbp2
MTDVTSADAFCGSRRKDAGTISGSGKVSLPAGLQESEMRALKNGCRLAGLLLIVLIGTIAVPRPAFADDNNADKNAGNPPAKTSPAKIDAPAPGLTERERWLLDQVEELKKRVAELESKANPPAAPAAEAPAAQPAASNTANPSPALSHLSLSPTPANSGSFSSSHDAAAVGPSQTSDKNAANAAKSAVTEPFAYADWTWLNGTARNKDVVWDSKFFTPEVRFDTNFVSSFNHPKDDSLGGSTEIFRSNEFQVEQISFGGDFHWQNVRGRVLTLGGMFGVTTPRNDGSVGRGQWDLRGAYKYFAEAYGGYHFNVNHGLNIDAGIFVSYIGLFSYYNFDNWAYQPSYVSSNTPWFFNGLRIQWFPTDKLKIEPWIINGWQSYGRFGNKPGLGGQILWRPKPWLSMVFNNYGMGEDTLGLIGRSRIHTDDSIEVKYYDNPSKTLDKMAFSVTGDLGCEYGGGVSCYHNTAGGPKQSFAGWMAYNRFWFKQDHYGLTLGYGVLDNPGRYLTLLPPINGADAVSGSPYFPASPGTPYKAWDTLATFDWMPKQYITFRWEYGYRHADQPYWSGRGGITPPGGNNSSPGNYVCSTGASAGTADLPTAETACGTPGSASGVWFPDLVKNEPSIRMAIMVKF